MPTANDGRPETSAEARSAPSDVVKNEPKPGLRASGPPAEPATHTNQTAAPPMAPPTAKPPSRPVRKWLLVAGAVVGLAVGGYFLVPWVVMTLNTVSTDDAYVNGHVTFAAPRVAGQVTRVLVDNNMRVKRGDLLVQLDKEPYQVQVNIKQDALVTAERDLEAADAQARGQIANLAANVATLNGRKADLALAQDNFDRGKPLAPRGALSKEDFDQRRQTVKADEAAVEQALQTVYASRVSLGLPAKPASGHDLAEVPTSLDSTPRQAETDSDDTQGGLDSLYAHLVREVPAVKQSEAKVPQARDDLAQAELNLRYCDIVSDIDGQVLGRNVNPGDYVQVGQSLMAVRSLTEIWIDANFKETQLADLRIGHRVRCEVDMYGRRCEFEGRITGFTMGTGQTLALLPPQNATGNFVKIVQRLPVRVELTEYTPDKNPLFVGLSVVPYVYYKEPPAGPHAGAVLQPFAPLPQLPTNPKP